MKNSARYLLLARLYGALLPPDAQQRLDATDGTAAFARQFEHVETELARTEFSPLKSEMFIEYDTSAPAGARSITHRTVTQVGNADFVDYYADDLPHADVFTVEDEVKCEPLGVQYFYSVDDVRAAAMDSTFRLDTERKQSAIDAMRRKHDQVAAIGSTKHARTGFINSSAVPTVSVITGTWAAATSAQIVADVVKLWASIPAATKDVIQPDTLLLDTASHSLISSKPYGVDSDMTVLKWLLNNLDGCKKIDRWDRLGTAGAGSTKRMVAYKKSKDVVKYNAPDLFSEEAPQKRNLKIVTPCHAKTGFTEIRKPLGVAYMDGI